MTQLLIVEGSVLLGVWLLEAVLFVLSYRTSCRAERSR
jgi:hypothetical protein